MRRTASFILSVVVLVAIIVIIVRMSKTLIPVTFPYGTNDVKRTSILKNPDSYEAISELPNLRSDSNAKVISSEIFHQLIETAKSHSRKRRMVDLTKDPKTNSMQSLMNVWANGSYSPVHMHNEFSQAFVVLQGALAFFTFSPDGSDIECHVLHDGSFTRSDRARNSSPATTRSLAHSGSGSRSNPLPGSRSGSRLGSRAGSVPKSGSAPISGSASGSAPTSAPKSASESGSGSSSAPKSGSGSASLDRKTSDRAMIVEKGQFHAMTAAPPELGWPGFAVVFETSGHHYDPALPTKTLASFAPALDDGRNGDPEYFSRILSLCPSLNNA